MTTTEDGRLRLAEARRRLTAFSANPAQASNRELTLLRHTARAAIDRLDDEPEFDDAHQTLDEVGAFVRNNRPELCFFAEKSDGFAQECPIALGHIRMGLSVGAEIEESHCSICGEDLWECPHVPGEIYDGQPVVRVITKAWLFEASLVDRPDFPDARITSRSISRAEVEAAFGGPLPANARPVCGRCLSPCAGIGQRRLDANT